MPLRIAHVISSPRGIGGAERVVADLARGLADRGDDVLVLQPFLDEEPSSLAQLCAPVRCVGRAARRPADVVRVRRWLADELAAFRPDVVHAHLVHAQVVVATLPRSAAPVRVTTHHHGDTLEHHGRRLLGAADRWSLRRYDQVVTVSEWGRGYLERRDPALRAHVRCIHNGWRGAPVPRRPRTSRRPTVVCVGNLRPEKGHDVLLRAFAQVLRSVPDAVLQVVGDGPCRPALQQQALEGGFGDSVVLLGARDDVWEVLADADVFTLPSHREALGLAALEAMAAGLPVVGTRVGGIPELVEPGVTGALVARGDAGELAEQLIALLLAPEQAASLGAAAAASAAARTAATMVQEYSDTYRACLGQTGAR